MKFAIMQPYFFPYLGYWQMFSAVDKFVIYDDVNFIMRGYINRNSILVNGEAHLFSIPLEKPSQNKLIKDTKLKFDTKSRENFLKTITMAYKKASYFSTFYPILCDIIYKDTNDLTTFIKHSFEKIKEYLGLNTQILMSSEIEKDEKIRGQDKIVALSLSLL